MGTGVCTAAILPTKLLQCDQPLLLSGCQDPVVCNPQADQFYNVLAVIEIYQDEIHGEVSLCALSCRLQSGNDEATADGR